LRQIHAAILTAHHLVCDGWSFNIILREIVAAMVLPAEGPEALSQPFAFSTMSGWNTIDPAKATTEAYWLAQYADPYPA
jgi:hypothetical protein